LSPLVENERKEDEMKRSKRVVSYPGLVLVVVVLGLTLGCQPQAPSVVEEAMPSMEPYLAIWNEGNLDLVDELYSPDFVWHVVDVADDVVGTEAFKEMVTNFRTAFPDFHVTFDEVFSAGDKTVVRWTMTGTNTGPFQGMPPTGQPVRMSGVAISRDVDDKTAEVWQHYNPLAMYTQMGYTLTPPTEEPAAEE
jgi:steroid delta-isomerase-like uncharacterized protein